MSVEIFSTAAQPYKKSHLERQWYSRWMTLKVTQGHPSCHYLIGHISLSISGLSVVKTPSFTNVWPWGVLQVIILAKTVELTKRVLSGDLQRHTRTLAMVPFMSTGQTVADKWQFLVVQMAAVRHRGLSKIWNFIWQFGSQGQHALKCQISCHQSHRCWDMAIFLFFKMTAIKNPRWWSWIFRKITMIHPAISRSPTFEHDFVVNFATYTRVHTVSPSCWSTASLQLKVLISGCLSHCIWLCYINSAMLIVYSWKKSTASFSQNKCMSVRTCNIDSSLSLLLSHWAKF